jgi:dephospho-CoA kinase
VLGGIASGKSRVAELLAGPRGVVIDADRLAHEALDEPAVRERIRARFGPGVFGSAGGVDRGLLAREVFGDPGARAALEGWVHPRVRERIAAALARARQEGAARVVLDVPLLLENEGQHGLLALCDRLVFVDAPAEARERRAMAARGWAAEELARREAAQLPLAEKRARAQHVIENDGDLAALAAAVSDLLERLEGPARVPDARAPKLDTDLDTDWTRPT